MNNPIHTSLGLERQSPVLASSPQVFALATGKLGALSHHVISALSGYVGYHGLSYPFSTQLDVSRTRKSIMAAVCFQICFSTSTSCRRMHTFGHHNQRSIHGSWPTVRRGTTLARVALPSALASRERQYVVHPLMSSLGVSLASPCGGGK